jgi:hypothetical protein
LTLVADVPAGVVTVTSTVLPIEFVMVGEVAVIVVPETTVTPVAGTVPKWTAVSPVKLDPVIVTAVPPGVVVEAVDDVTVGPEEGLTAVTTGAAVAAPAGAAARNPRAGTMRATAASAPTFARDFIVSFHQSLRIPGPIPLHSGGTRVFPVPVSAKQGISCLEGVFGFPIPLPGTRPGGKLRRMLPRAAIWMRRPPHPMTRR